MGSLSFLVPWEADSLRPYRCHCRMGLCVPSCAHLCPWWLWETEEREGNNCGFKERGLLTACAAAWLCFPYHFIKICHIRAFFYFSSDRAWAEHLHDFSGGGTGLTWSLIQKEIGYRTKSLGHIWGVQGKSDGLKQNQRERMPTQTRDSAYHSSRVHSDLVNMCVSTMVNYLTNSQTVSVMFLKWITESKVQNKDYSVLRFFKVFLKKKKIPSPGLKW